MSVVMLSSKGHIVLPETFLHALGLQQGDQLEVTLEGDRLVLTRLAPAPMPSWRRWRGRLAGTGALQAHVADHADEVQRERLP
jgi:bifunctional DNA-binding transcriptional regulator/antitoxin component of YhaV-PrlF toxin-antitoxin module